MPKEKKIFKMLLSKDLGNTKDNRVLFLFNANNRHGNRLLNMFNECKNLKVVIGYGRQGKFVVFDFTRPQQ